MLPELAAGAIVRLLNRQLEREPTVREHLLAFAGRNARFELPPFAIAIGIDHDGRFRAAAGAPDVTIALDAPAVPAALFGTEALQRSLRVDGDAEFGQALAQALQRLRPEPEEELSRFVGDAAAVRLVGAMRAAAATAADGADRLARSAADYLVAENPMLVSGREAEAFAREVSALRDAVERLDKRLALLAARRR
jgi:ubiquinone biosynthesis protein UbiJ